MVGTPSMCYWEPTGLAKLLPFILAALVLMGFFWNGWWLWAVLIFLLGRSYAEPMDQITPAGMAGGAVWHFWRSSYSSLCLYRCRW